MSESEKLTKSKDVIAYLAEQFPNCFSLQGDAKPLKIGIFEDLAKRLEGDEKVSKTRLRTALRHYTNSWRYLRSVKVGSERIDLDGNAVEKVLDEHQQHAAESLKESKERAAERAKQRKAADTKSDDARNKPKKKAAPVNKANKKPKPSRKPEPKLKDVELNSLSVGQQVQVKAGNRPMPGTVVEVDKTDVQVQLANGLSMKVKAENVFVKQ
ncbi:RNA chaperone ProQ [Idiomarina sp. MD25a]|uniref:RNA chaperone ProQ n=1 Tax=Idiomarina sp. MD25a TaxID=1889913 RepID=UPI0008F8511F|nr:RNA chaperone ProQ [Idiomarina sp. MD25a]OIM97365.1 RNA chaperone ProQ [Idiomarina sp. MD25a]